MIWKWKKLRTTILNSLARKTGNHIRNIRILIVLELFNVRTSYSAMMRSSINRVREYVRLFVPLRKSNCM